MEYVTDAPLHEWQRVHAFDSAYACREMRQAEIDAAEAGPGELAQLLEAEIARLKADLHHPNEAVRAAAQQALPLFASRREKVRQVAAAAAKLSETESRKRRVLGMRLAQCVGSERPEVEVNRAIWDGDGEPSCEACYLCFRDAHLRLLYQKEILGSV